jgi:uncharacterized membrane protein YidH (DUF202 family)
VDEGAAVRGSRQEAKAARIQREAAPEVREHMSWVRARMQLDAEMMENVRHGSSLIAAGFGSFAFLQGVVASAGEGEGFTSPSRAFSLVANVAGVAIILLAGRHNLQMSAWVDADEFPEGEAPELPQERLPYIIAAITVVIGVVAFVALLFVGDGPAG